MPDAVSIRTTRRRCLLVHVRPNAVQVVDEHGELGFVQQTTKGVIQGIYAIIEGLDQCEALVGDGDELVVFMSADMAQIAGRQSPKPIDVARRYIVADPAAVEKLRTWLRLNDEE